MDWPDGFLWGTGASSTQCEGAAPASDWIDWERAGRAPRRATATGSPTRYADDFRTYAGLGLRHHRLSIEWARIEPEPRASTTRRRSPTTARCSKPRAMPASCRGCASTTSRCRGGSPLGRLPRRAQPHRRVGAPRRLRRRDVRRSRRRLEAGERDQPLRDHRVPRTRLAARPPRSRRGRVRRRSDPPRDGRGRGAAPQTGAPVASIFSLSPIVEQDETAATAAMARAARRPPLAPGHRAVPRRRAAVSSRGGRSSGPTSRAPSICSASPTTRRWAWRDGRMAVHPPDAPVSPLGYGIWADGLGLVLDRLHAELPGTPLLVCRVRHRHRRRRRARRVPRARARDRRTTAIARGVDVRGFFHWTGVDNYEWLHGYDVSFGIIDRARRPRERRRPPPRGRRRSLKGRMMIARSNRAPATRSEADATPSSESADHGRDRGRPVGRGRRTGEHATDVDGRADCRSGWILGLDAERSRVSAAQELLRGRWRCDGLDE